MDDARFDALVRRLFAVARPRRGALAILASGVSGLLLSDAIQTTTAHRQRTRRRRDTHAQDISGAIKLPPGKRFTGCRFVSQTCGTVSVRRGKKVQKKVLRCCANSSCYRTGASGNLIPVGKNQRGRCSCSPPCYEDLDGDGICTLLVPPPCAGLNGACNGYDDCCDPGAGGGGNAVCIGDICTGRGFCPPATLACAVVAPQKGSMHCDAVPDFATQCCKLESMPCANDCQCCGSLRCENGVCVPCVSDGPACPAGCAADSECHLCCAGYCRVNGRCGPPQGCLEFGQVCTLDDLCCNDVPCIGPEGGPFRCRYP